jgi:hypothetical protein
MTTWRIQNYAASVGQPTQYDSSGDCPGEFEQFVEVSVALTGFSEAELFATGLVKANFDEVALVVGRTLRCDFLKINVKRPGDALSNNWAPLARNLIRMWYTGQWKHLQPDWPHNYFSEKELEKYLQGYDEFGRDIDRVISPLSYQAGLVWRAIGVNPPGAKQPGFASWTGRLP